MLEAERAGSRFKKPHVGLLQFHGLILPGRQYIPTLLVLHLNLSWRSKYRHSMLTQYSGQTLRPRLGCKDKQLEVGFSGKERYLC